ncbi:uncharacterized protein LOC142956561 [Anarhichas minor]|uniref:uncharacterized protein LOC142956561 n=1 Tax=Anarhichas minor TaxID=65739 RepID=UPI003F736FF3
MAKRGTRDFFAWTDDEVELLLKVTHEYKMVKAAQNTDWESLQNKYGDILDHFIEHYPTPADAMHMGKDYPHNKDELTKVKLTTKIKAIRVRYRQAVESGKKRGHGRVLLLYFELCESIWGVSPATSAIREGINTEDINTEDIKTEDIKTEDMAVEVLGANGSTSHCGSSSVSGGDRGTKDATSAATVAIRHQRLDASLGGHRRERLKRKLSMDSVAREDLEIKRQLLQCLQATDAKLVETMGRWSSSMDRLNTNIEVLMQHIMGSRNRPTTPHSSHNQAHGQKPSEVYYVTG